MILVITSVGMGTLLQSENDPRFAVSQSVLCFSQTFILFISAEIFDSVPHLIFSLTEASLIVSIVLSIKAIINEVFKG